MAEDTQPLGATPGDDISGLKQHGLTTRQARNAAELEAITHAYQKYVFKPRRRLDPRSWLTDSFIRVVHYDMFGEIWDWAGAYRKEIVNIGVAPHMVPEQVGNLCGDFEYWNSPHSSMPGVEVAARLQNRLTRIHPFKNGNGRHARLITDIYFTIRNHPLPKWPQIQLSKQGDVIRGKYISAMKKADQEDYSLLIEFFNDCLIR